MQGDFRIDEWLIQPQINSVEKNGKTWHLEPKVMQVLVHLASHPNEVLSKDRLLEAVWHNTFVGDDVLVRCISEIRYVFGDDPKSDKADRRRIAPNSEDQGPRDGEGKATVNLVDATKNETLATVHVTRGMKQVEIGRSCRTLDAR